ncbi:hypothetical protein MB02_01310 [Croceicoccus estronivorus]|uniref:hypothetical protein n=1 Tax=Croceicoccus estronivorus TaxID=1172626 RepID=UPI00082EFBA2|nr:hypothetical protein [Croceicoccus estronivorus]OCC25337.1 hypothetical protein MB02_01310 [Croceicoccus estronivorus]
MLFDHEDIEVLPIEQIPLERDIYLMDVCWMEGYSASLLNGINGGEWDNVGYISYACAHHVDEHGVELTWYPNIFDRFHKVRVRLPRRHFVTCTELWQYDEKPRVFVSSEWLENLHMRVFSAFALVDAIGVKHALANDEITTEKLSDLRARIDAIAAAHNDLAFISFADSLIVKMNWTVGQWDQSVGYTYEPEKILAVMPELALAFKGALGLPIYAVITQGQNEFYGDELTHTSLSGNHLSLNSLGLPFAQLQSIEATAKQAARVGNHQHAELYMDESFFRSLKFEHSFDMNSVPTHPYLPPMSAHPCQYMLATFETILSNLQTAS